MAGRSGHESALFVPNGGPLCSRCRKHRPDRGGQGRPGRGYARPSRPSRDVRRCGRSAVSSSSGSAERSASTAAGNRLATAVPEVVITAAARPDAAAIPRAWKAAERSSMAVVSVSKPRSARPPAASASGAERLPGQSTNRCRPWRCRHSSRPMAETRLSAA